MNYREFRNLVKTTLDQQQVYFKTRTQGDLEKSKSLERLVRKTIKEENERNEGEMTLFDAMGNPQDPG